MKKQIILTILIVLIPLFCFADALVPFTSFFSTETFLPALILLSVIILIEALLLKAFLKTVAFRKHILFSALINIISSGCGSLIFLITKSRRDLYYFDKVFVLMFVLTIIIEYPIIKLFYRRIISWLKCIWINLALNVLSYILLVILQFLFLFVASYASYFFIERTRARWTDSDILKNEPGNIYIYDKGLRRYNIQKGEFETFLDVNIPIYEYKTWDISTDIFACVLEERFAVPDSAVTIYKIPEGLEILKIPGRFSDFALDSKGEYLALLQRHSSVNIPGRTGVYYDLGDKCILSIISIKTGERIFEYPEFALNNGIDWSPDSKKIAFVSFLDKSLFKYKSKIAPRSWDLPYYYDKFPKCICVYDLEKDSLHEIDKGISPSWSHDGTRIMYIREGKVFIYSLDSKKIEKLRKIDNVFNCKWSPTDESIIAYTFVEEFFNYRSDFVIIDIENPARKYLLIPNEHIRGFEWE
jgi:hypothetical protein